MSDIGDLASELRRALKPFVRVGELIELLDSFGPLEELGAKLARDIEEQKKQRDALGRELTKQRELLANEHADALRVHQQNLTNEHNVHRGRVDEALAEVELAKTQAKTLVDNARRESQIILTQAQDDAQVALKQTQGKLDSMRKELESATANLREVETKRLAHERVLADIMPKLSPLLAK